MDISVQLNIKYSKFTTIYPKFNKKNGRILNVLIPNVP